MAQVRFDTSDVDRLVDALDLVEPLARDAAFAVVKRGAHEVSSMWKTNILELGHRRLRLEALAIGYDAQRTEAGAEVVVKPDTTRPQGGMTAGDEYGSIHTPPHMNANRAVDREDPLFVDAAAQYVGWQPLRDVLRGK